jgi:uncharacterized membrane protein
MDPIMRLVLTAVGALIGAGIAGPGAYFTDALFGALVGFGIAEISDLRSRQRKLEADIGRLRVELRERPAAPATAGAATTSTAIVPTAAAPPAVAPKHAPLPWHELEEHEPPGDERPTPSAPSLRSAAPLPGAASATARPSRPPPAAELPWIAAVRRFFTGGNAMVRIGVVVLFFGVAFLLRYMAEHSHVPIELRLMGVALGSIALLVFGWRLRTARKGYALAVQGGGVGILYLTVFGALRLYGVLPAAMAFPLLACVAVLSAVLAILQDSLWFALLGVTGGFLAPVLASTGQGSHVTLFSYYAILNFGILAVAWFKAWRPLNIAGFVFTFAIGTAWGVLQYRPEDFASTEPFLVLFFFFYLGISVLFTLRQPVRLTGYLDGTLIFGTPIVVFALQSSMLHGRLMPLAYSAIALSAVYLLAALLLKRRRNDPQADMVEAFIALGIAFLTLAIPLALDARWIAVAWALEGSALVWVGCRQHRLLPRVCGAVLSVAAGLALSKQFDLSTGHALLTPAAYMSLVTVAAATLFSAGTLKRNRDGLRDFEQAIPDLLFCWSLLLWVIGSLCEISRYLPNYTLAAALIFATATALLCSEIHRRLELAAARSAALLLWPVMLVFAAHAAWTLSHPGAEGGSLSWPVTLFGAYLLMHRLEGEPRAALANVLHTLSTWLVCALSSWELAWDAEQLMPGGPSWSLTAWALIPALLLFLMPKLVTRVPWPFARNRDTYLFITGVGMALYLGVWSLCADGTVGGSAPLPYLPLLNPADLAEAFVLLTLMRYWRFLKAVRSAGFARLNKSIPIPALCALAFLWLNAALLRTLHHWFGIPFKFDTMVESTLVQTSLSIFWAVLALAAMLLATRKKWRVVWLVGAALLAVVIAKLFLVDLSNVGSIERIVSFLGVGILMLIVGYLSPLPPAETAAR